MSVIPDPPTFTDNAAPSLSQLQALAQSVSFLVDTDNRPVWHFYKTTANQGTSSDSWTQVNQGSAAVDSDGVQNAPDYNGLIVTPGYYALESCISIQNNASSVVLFATCLGILAGPNNPNLTNGDYYFFGYRCGDAAQTNQTLVNSDSAYCAVDITPWPLYAGDTVACFVWTNTGATVDYNNLGNYQYGRWVCNFTGYWLHSASLTQPNPTTYNLTTSDA